MANEKNHSSITTSDISERTTDSGDSDADNTDLKMIAEIATCSVNSLKHGVKYRRTKWLHDSSSVAVNGQTNLFKTKLCSDVGSKDDGCSSDLKELGITQEFRNHIAKKLEHFLDCHIKDKSWKIHFKDNKCHSEGIFLFSSSKEKLVHCDTDMSISEKPQKRKVADSSSSSDDEYKKQIMNEISSAVTYIAPEVNNSRVEDDLEISVKKKKKHKS